MGLRGRKRKGRNTNWKKLSGSSGAIEACYAKKKKTIQKISRPNVTVMPVRVRVANTDSFDLIVVMEGERLPCRPRTSMMEKTLASHWKDLLIPGKIRNSNDSISSARNKNFGVLWFREMGWLLLVRATGREPLFGGHLYR